MNLKHGLNSKTEEMIWQTEEIRQYRRTLKNNARAAGRDKLVLISGHIHKDLGLKHRHPPVCNAMRDCMQEGDVVLHTTPSGYSSTIEIEYKLR